MSNIYVIEIKDVVSNDEESDEEIDDILDSPLQYENKKSKIPIIYHSVFKLFLIIKIKS